MPEAQEQQWAEALKRAQQESRILQNLPEEARRKIEEAISQQAREALIEQAAAEMPEAEATRPDKQDEAGDDVQKKVQDEASVTPKPTRAVQKNAVPQKPAASEPNEPEPNQQAEKRRGETAGETAEQEQKKPKEPYRPFPEHKGGEPFVSQDKKDKKEEEQKKPAEPSPQERDKKRAAEFARKRRQEQEQKQKTADDETQKKETPGGRDIANFSQALRNFVLRDVLTLTLDIALFPILFVPFIGAVIVNAIPIGTLALLVISLVRSQPNKVQFIAFLTKEISTMWIVYLFLAVLPFSSVALIILRIKYKFDKSVVAAVPGAGAIAGGGKK